MPPSPRPSWLQTRLSGAGTGALAGLLLVLLEVPLRYLPALHGTQVPPQGLLPVAAALMASAGGALAGLVHPLLPALVLAVAAATGSLAPAVAAGLGLAAGTLAWALRRWPWALRRWPWTAALPVLGLLGLALAWQDPRPAVGATDARDGRPPDIVLVVLDTVAADETSLHGAPLDTTPTLQALAAWGTWFTQATSPAPWTVPAHAAILTGQMPDEVGCHHEHPALPPGVPTTAEALAAAGYRTGAFLANPWVGRFNGLTRGFAHQESQWERARAARAFSLLGLLPHQPGKGGAAIVGAALRWLDTEPERPAFVLINLLEAHSPFQDTPQADRYGVLDPQGTGDRSHQVQEAGPAAVPDYPRPGELDQARRLHAAGIRADDDLVGQLLTALQDRGRWDRTALVVTADHGEAFGEHGFYGHMIGLHTETLHVPLVVRSPGSAAARVDSPVSTLRIHPTILALAGLNPGDAAPLGLGGAPQPPAPWPESVQLRPLQVLADRRREGQDAGLGELDGRAARARDARWAVLARAPADGGPTAWSLYDLQADPQERRDLQPELLAGTLDPDQQAAIAALHVRVQVRLARLPSGQAAATAPPLGDDLRVQLQALGYLGGD